jgi:hypothetical protein
MSMDRPNPYTSPMADFGAPPPGAVDPRTVEKVEAIIKDAGQFWLAILMCIFCSGLGSIIIGPWYLVRLLQWNSLATSQPMLVDPHVSRGSIAHRFQSAKIKLIIGICFGAVTLVLTVLVVAVLIASAPR